MSNELTQKIDYEAKAKEYLQSKNINLSENELQQFILACQAYQLNPVKNEIYAIKYSNKGYSTFNIVVNYQVILEAATRHPDFAGVEVDYYDGNKPLLKPLKDARDLWAMIRIYKYVNGQRLLHNTDRIDYANDYQQQRNNTFAKNYFTTWCQKLAFVTIVRKTYPAETQGMYISDEFAAQEPVTPAIETKTTNYDLAVQELEQIQDVATRNSILRKFLQENNIGISNFKKGEFDIEKFNEAVKAELVDIDTIKEELE